MMMLPPRSLGWANDDSRGLVVSQRLSGGLYSCEVPPWALRSRSISTNSTAFAFVRMCASLRGDALLITGIRQSPPPAKSRLQALVCPSGHGRSHAVGGRCAGAARMAANRDRGGIFAMRSVRKRYFSPCCQIDIPSQIRVGIAISATHVGRAASKVVFSFAGGFYRSSRGG
jgi:hypothetical protein